MGSAAHDDLPRVPWGGPDPERPTVRSVLALADDLDALLDEIQGEVTPDVEQQLAAIEGDAVQVAERLRKAAEAYSARAEHMRQRARSCTALAREAEGKADRCEGAIRVLLERLGKNRLELEDGDVKLGRHRVEALPGASLDALPPELVRERTSVTREPNLTAIGVRINAGETVPGFRRVRGVSFR